MGEKKSDSFIIASYWLAFDVLRFVDVSENVRVFPLHYSASVLYIHAWYVSLGGIEHSYNAMEEYTTHDEGFYLPGKENLLNIAAIASSKLHFFMTVLLPCPGVLELLLFSDGPHCLLNWLENLFGDSLRASVPHTLTMVMNSGFKGKISLKIHLATENKNAAFISLNISSHCCFFSR